MKNSKKEVRVLEQEKVTEEKQCPFLAAFPIMVRIDIHATCPHGYKVVQDEVKNENDC